MECRQEKSALPGPDRKEKSVINRKVLVKPKRFKSVPKKSPPTKRDRDECHQQRLGAEECHQEKSPLPGPGREKNVFNKKKSALRRRGDEKCLPHNLTGRRVSSTERSAHRIIEVPQNLTGRRVSTAEKSAPRTRQCGEECRQWKGPFLEPVRVGDHVISREVLSYD